MYNYVLNEIGFMRNDTTASFSAFKTQKLQSCFLCAVEMQKDTPRPRLPTMTQLLLCDEQNDAHGVDDDEAGQDRDDRAVHGHRHGHFVEGDICEKNFHVFD